MTNFKNGFFDRDAVLKSVAAAERKAQSKAGAYVRQSAKSSLRYRQKPSAPGSPPSVHRGSKIKGRMASLLKELIYFARDESTRSVVIGPEVIKQRFAFGHRQPSSGTVPGTLEEGGGITVVEVFVRGQWKRLDEAPRRKLGEFPRRTRIVKIDARPFMRPAMEANQGKIVDAHQSSM